MHPAFLYVPDRRLSLAELTAARIDGHVVDIGDAYFPADLVEGRDVRAASVSALLRDGTAACGPTAAWIHGALDTPPTPHHLRRAVARRIRPPQNPRITYHDSAPPEEDVELIGGVPVATAERTVFDLALGLHRDPQLVRWLRALTAIEPEWTSSALRRMDLLRRAPGSRAGRDALERLDAAHRQDEVTRYTS
ncbi:hypothetical protein [Microbacterium sp. 179-I 3D4 NHS]|uniref:hypothetical protein n=1 Tax=Microbacterium sp. 179-I 3D4 NHS TaxID=3142381 RepID=UPI0039A33132